LKNKFLFYKIYIFFSFQYTVEINFSHYLVQTLYSKVII